MWVLIEHWWLTIWLVALPLIVGITGHFVVYKLIRKATRKSANFIDDSLARHCYRPAQWTVILLFIRVAMTAALPADTTAEFNHLLGLLLIAAISWLLIKTRASWYSFHRPIPLKIAAVRIPGEAKGSITFWKVWKLVHPSMIAASSNSLGRVAKKPVNRNTVKGIDKLT